MRTTPDETRAYSAKSRPASTTNERKHTPVAVRCASGTRRFGPNLGEVIIIALALGAAARLAGSGQ